MSTCDDWIATKTLEGRSKRTCEAYRATVERLAVFLGRDPYDATTQEVRAFLSSLRETCSNVTINNNRRNLNSYYAFLEDEDMVAKSPMRKIHHIKEDKPVKSPFSDEEMELIYGAASTCKERAIISFLSSTGCRVGELVGILLSDVDMNEREAKVYGKGGKERIVFFDTKAKLALEAYLDTRDDECPLLFASGNGAHAKAYTTGGIETMVRNVGNRAGVSNVHPHRFRRTVATRAINRGMPIEQVKELLGHSQIQTTMIYASVSKENVKASHKRYLS